MGALGTLGGRVAEFDLIGAHHADLRAREESFQHETDEDDEQGGKDVHFIQILARFVEGMSGLASGSPRFFRRQVLAALGWRRGLDPRLQRVWRGTRQHLDQDLGDAVGLDTLNGKSVGPDLDAGVFGGEFAEVVQHQAAEGADIINLELGLEAAVEVIEGHGPRQGKAVVRQLVEPVIIRLVRRRRDVAKDGAQQVTHGDNPGDTAILVHHQGKGLLALAEGGEEVGGGLGFGDEVRRAQQAFQGVSVLAQCLEVRREEIAGVEYADDIVAVFVINGHARLAAVAEDLQDFGAVGLHGHEGDVGPGRHEVVHALTAEIEDLIDVLGLGMVQGALADRHVGQGADHVLGDEVAPRALLADEKGGEKLRDDAYHPADGRDQAGELVDERALEGSEGDIVADGEDLGRDLPEYQEEGDHDEEVDEFILGAKEMDDHGRRNDRGGDVDELVANEDGDDESSGLAQDTFDEIDAAIAIGAHLFDLHLVEGEEGGFSAGKKARKAEQDNEDYQLDDECNVQGVSASFKLDVVEWNSDGVGWRG